MQLRHRLSRYALLAALAVTQAFGREEACQREFDEENGAYRDANYRAILYDALLDALVEGFSIVCAAMEILQRGQARYFRRTRPCSGTRRVACESR